MAIPQLQQLTLRIVSRVGEQQVSVPGFTGGELQVQYNPTEYGTERTTNYAEVAVPGLDSPVLQFVRGNGDKLTFELLLDVTDLMVDGVVQDGTSVYTRYVQPLERLLLQHELLHAPPVVELAWERSIIPRAVATSLSVKYTLFDVEGRPVRATATLQLREHRSAAEQLAEAHLQSVDLTSVVTLRQGDTLPAIAFREYGDASRWRDIATANALSNPLELTPGRTLIIPRIQS